MVNLIKLFSKIFSISLCRAIKILKSFLPKRFILNIKFIIMKIKKIKHSVKFSKLVDLIDKFNQKIIITFPIISWEYRWQRPQHIVSAFSKDDYFIFILNMDFHLKNELKKFKKYKSLEEAKNSISLIHCHNNIFKIEYDLASTFNIYTDNIDGDNLQNIYLGISSILEGIKNKDLFYLIQYPRWAPLVFKLKEIYGGKIIFDFMDEHAGFGNVGEDIEEVENNLIKKADLVISSSSRLEVKAKRINRNTILVKNAAEFEHFNNIYPNGKLDFIKNKVIIGYYGAIGEWFDMELVEYCAKKKPDWCFVLIGRITTDEITRISELKNVFLLGEKKYRELPGYLYYFDVCIIPFKITPLTLATNPVKFYEYISAGKPVVSVRLPEVEFYKNYCYLADTKEEFLYMLEKALIEKEDKEKIEERIKLARENTWESRYKVIKDALLRLGSMTNEM